MKKKPNDNCQCSVRLFVCEKKVEFFSLKVHFNALAFRKQFDVINYIAFCWTMCGFMGLATLQLEMRLLKCIRIGKAIFRRYIVGYMLGNHVLRLCSRVIVKLNFRPYIQINILNTVNPLLGQHFDKTGNLSPIMHEILSSTLISNSSLKWFL